MIERKNITLMVTGLALSVIAVLHFLIFDWLYLEKTLIAEGYPDFSIFGTARIFTMLLCALSLLLILVTAGYTYRRPLMTSRTRWIGWLLNGLTIGFVLILIRNPIFFNYLSHEDSVVEWASFIFLIGAALICASTAWDARRCRASFGPFSAWFCLMATGVR